MCVHSVCASAATSVRMSTDMRRTDGYLFMKFEPCVLPKCHSFHVPMLCSNVFVYNVHTGFRLRSIVTAHMNVLPHKVILHYHSLAPNHSIYYSKFVHYSIYSLYYIISFY